MEQERTARRAAGRPRDLRKAQAILDAAWSLFLARGVEAAPIEEIAAAAGVSKGTLYAAYPDKAALFRAAVLREMERIEAAQQPPVGEAAAPLAEVLQAFGRGIMAFLASEPAIGFYNVLAAELRRRPELAAAFWSLGPGRTRANLAAILAAAAARGEIAVASPEDAAEVLFGMWQGFASLQLALGLEPASVDERVDRGVAAFLKAFASPPAAGASGAAQPA